MRFCKIVDDKVINVIKATQEFVDKLPDTYMQHDTASIGWIVADGMLIEAPAESPTFQENKSQKLKDLIVHVNKLHDDYLAKYPEVEIDTFKDKAREAALVMADNTIALTETPYLSKLTNNVIEARNALAIVVDNKVLENAQLEVFGVTTRDAIKACTTQEELDAIVW